MSIHQSPIEPRIPPTDSNASTGLNDSLVENLFEKVRHESKYQIREINAGTLKYHSESAESSTTEFIDIDFLEQQASSIFARAKEEVFEDGMESDFSQNLSAFIKSFGHSAMEIIIPIMLSEQTNAEIASEAFRILGRLNNNTTYRERLWLLERGLYSASARVRDGAVLGLAFLNDPLAVAPLKATIDRERIPELRKDMEQVLAQLEGDKDGISSTKDS
jgi:hypothetical protein